MRRILPWIITIVVMGFLVWGALAYDGGCVVVPDGQNGDPAIFEACGGEP